MPSPEFLADRANSQNLSLPQDGKTRIYILGCGRSGTTLMASMMTCFTDTYVLLDDAALGGEDYAGRFLRIDRPERTHVIKRSSDSYKFSPNLPEDLWLIYMLRHPMDVFTSTLKVNGKTHENYITTERWLAENEALKKLAAQKRERLLWVRYEELVTQPDETQHYIADRTGLEIAKPFSRYNEGFKSSATIEDSMNGPRPPDGKSINRWRLPEYDARVNQVWHEAGPEIGWFMHRFGYGRRPVKREIYPSRPLPAPILPPLRGC